MKSIPLHAGGQVIWLQSALIFESNLVNLNIRPPLVAGRVRVTLPKGEWDTRAAERCRPDDLLGRRNSNSLNQGALYKRKSPALAPARGSTPFTQLIFSVSFQF